MDISAAFEARDAALEFPAADVWADREERIEALRAYDAQRNALTEEFAAALSTQYLSSISAAHRAPIAASTFQMAWAEGHSSGYSGVENSYMDLAAFAVEVYQAATS